MDSHQILIICLIALVIFILPAIGAYLLFKKAGRPGWFGLVPIINSYEMVRISGRSPVWFFLQFIPVVGWFISLGILVEFIKVFGKFKFYQHALTVCTAGLYFLYVGLDPKTKYLGPEAVKKYKKSTVREWVDAGVFAVVAATLIRTFVFEAYTIPTGSMEKTLLINDFLFVSKFSYGPRIPNTPLSIPFVHNTMPVTNGNSYVEWIKIPYTRWFPSAVKRNDVVVFNFPEGDTVINLPEYQSQQPYYEVCRSLGRGNIDSGRQIVLQNPDQYPLVMRPIDKEENYIKRCVAIPGDTLAIRDHVVFINGQAQAFPPESQTWYLVQTKGQPLDETALKETYNLDITNTEEFRPTDHPNEYRMLLDTKARETMTKSGLATSIVAETDSSLNVYPYSPLLHWDLDDYGPLFVPRSGSTIALTPVTYALYERVIRVYEDNAFTMQGGRFYLNGQEVKQYTFRNNYYWMMGDNRHDSQDSRFWGFVPEDHIVGKAALIWMSWGNGVRWNRLFKTIH